MAYIGLRPFSMGVGSKLRARVETLSTHIITNAPQLRKGAFLKHTRRFFACFKDRSLKARGFLMRFKEYSEFIRGVGFSGNIAFRLGFLLARARGKTKTCLEAWTENQAWQDRALVWN